MGFATGNYARVWEVVETKDKYTVVKMSTSKKNKQTNEYEQDWADGRVRLVGTAHNQIKALGVGDKGVSVKIGSCDVSNKYDKDKKTTYTNYVVFNFDDATNNNTNGSQANTQTPTAPAQEDDDLPF